MLLKRIEINMAILDKIVKNVQARSIRENSCLKYLIEEEVKVAIKKEGEENKKL